LLIALLAHVVVIAVASMLFFHQDGPAADYAPTQIRIVQDEPPPPELADPKIVDREDQKPELRDDTPVPDLKPWDPNPEPDVTPTNESPEEALVPYDSAFRGEAGGPTAIGVGQFGHRGPHSPFTGKPGGKYGHYKFGRVPRGSGPPKAVEDPVQYGLLWLKKHQDEDGRWDADRFMKHDAGEPCTGPGNQANDVGVTALALLAFLGDGNTLKDGVYRKEVRSAVRWLLSQQEETTGLIGTRSSQSYMYSHAIATLALCEAYGLSVYKPMQKPAQAAVNYIVNARNPYGVWRYEPKPVDGDASVSAWMVQALLSAKEFDLAVDDAALRGAMVWFDGVTDPATGSAGYTRQGEGSSRPTDKVDRFPAARTEALTSAVLLCRYLMNESPADKPVMKRATETILSKLPEWNEKDGSIDMYYWYYASYAMFQASGRAWDLWSKSLNKAVIKTQRMDGNAKGSWDPVDPWGEDGGRVYSTAIMVLCLESYYRYARVQGAR
jgi:hypothetical protein